MGDLRWPQIEGSEATVLPLASTSNYNAAPEEWRVVPLGEVADLRLGRTPARKELRYWQNGSTPWVSIADLNNSYVRTTKESISDTAYREVFRERLSPEGTLLLSFKLTIGRVGILEVPAAHNEAIASIFPKGDSAFMRDFLFYLLQAIEYEKYIDGYVKGNTLNKQKLEALPLLLPPLPEQRAIAHVLSTVQKSIETTEKIIHASRELKRSLMNHLFTYGPVSVDEAEQVPLKETEIGPVPEHWEIVTLDEAARIERGKFAHRPRNDPRFYGGAIPFIQTGDVARTQGHITTYSQTLNELGLSVSRIFPRGTIVLTIAANIGHTGILAFDSAFPDSLVGITPKAPIDAMFLEHYLRTQKDEMDRLAPRGTQKNINIQFLKPWPVAKPPLTEQEEIVRILSSVNTKITAEENRKETLKILFKSLLHNLMTGKVRVNDLDMSAVEEMV